jgi:hypothetical protein
MARIVITIEDTPDGKVKTVADPNFETMMQMNASGHKLTSAHGYAIRALNAMVEASKEPGDHRIIIPKLIRRGKR